MRLYILGSYVLLFCGAKVGTQAGLLHSGQTLHLSDNLSAPSVFPLLLPSGPLGGWLDGGCFTHRKQVK